MNITIIGSGSFGCALAYVLGNKNNVKIWSFTEKERDYINNNHQCLFLKACNLNSSIKCYCDYKDAIDGSDYIIIASPSKTIRKTCADIKPYINNQKVILASKGFENNKVLSEVIKEELNMNCSVISGPSHAEQIIKNVPTYVEYSGEKEIKELFETDFFHLFYCDDMIGIQVGAALKNIISLMVGICEGLNYESNTISYIITEGLREIKEVGLRLGAKEQTFYGLSGLGDLLTTSLSLDSRNKKFGLLLSTGKKIEEIKDEIGMEIEALDNIEVVNGLVEKYDLNCYLIQNLYRILKEKSDINNILNRAL